MTVTTGALAFLVGLLVGVLSRPEPDPTAQQQRDWEAAQALIDGLELTAEELRICTETLRECCYDEREDTR